MRWKDISPGVRLGLILALINLILSVFIWNTDSIRNPEGFSDFESLRYPNILLGIPTIFIADLLSKGITNSYQQNLFIHLFIILTIYWFLVGLLISWLYKKIKNRKQISNN